MNARLPARLAALLLALATLLLGACQPDDPRCTELPGGPRYCLQPTADIAPFAVQQKVDIDFGGRRETLIVDLEVDEQAMRLIALTPFGQKLIELSFDNTRVHATRLPDTRLPPTLLLSVLQLTLWPAASVRAGLQAPARLEEQVGERRLLEADNLLMEVGYTGAGNPPDKLRIVLPAAGLHLTIETLNTDSTP